MENIVFTEKIIHTASVQTHPQCYSFEKHIHPLIELYEITEGCCHMDIGTRTISAEEGDFILILPSVVHSFYVNTDSSCTFKHIHCSPELFSHLQFENMKDYPMDILTALSFCCRSFYTTKADKRISELFSLILLNNKKDDSYSAAYANLYLTELLLYIIEYTKKDLSAYTQKHSEQNSYIAYTLDYIQEHYSSKIQTAEIAKHLNISPQYLSRIFSAQMNMTLLNYIHAFRINQAISLMINTDDTLTDISTQVGFNDSQHFSKLFRAMVGSSPYEYRKVLKDRK